MPWWRRWAKKQIAKSRKGRLANCETALLVFLGQIFSTENLQEFSNHRLPADGGEIDGQPGAVAGAGNREDLAAAEAGVGDGGADQCVVVAGWVAGGVGDVRLGNRAPIGEGLIKGCVVVGGGLVEMPRR